MMDVQIYGRDFKVGDTLEFFARKRLEKLAHYLPNIADIRLELAREHVSRGGTLSIAQITIRHQRGAILRAEERVNGEVELALNGALDKMQRQIERFKSRRSRKGGERFSATTEELDLAATVLADEDAPGVAIVEDDADVAAEIVRRKALAVTTMNEDEAIEQMELLGHTFFVFYNDATSSLNVLYKRRNGTYGLLVPQVE